MPNSPVPYQSNIPTVHLQEARLYENVDNELIVNIQVSNETKELLTSDAKEFGNFVYLSTDGEKILDLALNPTELKDLIIASQSDPSYLHNYYLSLTRQDFSLKPDTYIASPTVTATGAPIPDAPVYGYTADKTFVLNRVVGGNLMTGLIADAHIDKVYDGAQQVVGTYAAMGAAMRGESILPLGGGQFRIPTDLDVAAGRQTAAPEKVENLYILVASYRLYKGKVFLGNLVKEVLMENGNSPNSAALWHLSSNVTSYGPIGSIWPGDIHIASVNAQDLPMVGTVHSTTDHPEVQSTTVSNLKLKDLRFLTDARRLKFSYSSPTERQTPYFSGLTLSRDTMGQIHGTFGFDFGDFASHNTQYGPLMTNRSSLLGCVKIKEINIYRQVLKQSLEGNELTPDANINSIPPPSAGPDQTGWQRIEPMASQLIWNSQSQKYVKLKSEAISILDLPGIDEREGLNIIFMDTMAQHYKKGTLEYKVEIVIEDKTKDVLTTLRDGLLNVVAENWTDTMTAPSFVPILHSYLSAVSFIFGSSAFTQYSLETWKKNLESLAAPINPHEEDKLLVIDLVRDFTAKISEQLKTGQSISAGTFQVYSSIANPRPPSVLTATHFFKDRYRIRRAPGIGIDYSNGYLLNGNSALPRLSFAEFSARTNAEMAKYELTNPSALGINKYGYLSPDSLLFGIINNGQPRRISTTDYILKQDNFTPLFRNNALSTYVYVEQPQLSQETNITEIFASAGATVVQLKQPLREILFPTAEELQQSGNGRSYMAVMSPFNFAGQSESDALSGSSTSIIAASAGSLGMQIYDSAAVQWIFNAQIVGNQLPETLKNPMAIAGSVAAAKVAQFPDTIETSNSLSNLINFEALVRVEYLQSYDTEFGAAKPNWVILTENDFAEREQEAEGTLCRLVPLANIIDTDVDLGLDALNTLFILGSPALHESEISYLGVLNSIRLQIQSISGTGYSTLTNNDISYAQNVLVDL
jgi:hypothetical protein